jgi:triacylglycerol lipase
MYFPKGFDRELSIELGELIQQAYAQFESFERDVVWKLPEAYLLKGEFSYLWTPTKTIEKGILNFDHALARFSRTKKDKSIRIPIGFLAQRGNRLFLVIRGTQTAKEWVRNFSISLSDYLLPNFGRVHDGFLETYISIQKEIEDALSTTNSRAKLYVAGHSLGAALTTLALPDIESRLNRVATALYTYGSPRVGDDSFVKSFNAIFGQRSFRVANSSDIVTSIPLPAPIAGVVGGYFSHVDTPIDLTVQQEDLEKNHSMQTYLSALKSSKAQKGLLGKLMMGGA